MNEKKYLEDREVIARKIERMSAENPDRLADMITDFYNDVYGDDLDPLVVWLLNGSSGICEDWKNEILNED